MGLQLLVTTKLVIDNTNKEVVDERFGPYGDRVGPEGQNLLQILLEDDTSLSKRRFQFLVDLDPTALSDAYLFAGIRRRRSNTHENRLALHHAALHFGIQDFMVVFKAGILKLPRKAEGIDLLFREEGDIIVFREEDDDGNDIIEQPKRSSFWYACDRYGKENTLQAIDTVLTDCFGNTNENLRRRRPREDGDDDYGMALLSAAASDEWGVDELGNVKEGSLSCVYFMLRREPYVLGKLSSASTNDDERPRQRPRLD